MLCSIPLLILLGLGAAILGGLIVWFLRRPKISQLEDDLDRRSRQLKKSRTDFDTLNSKNQYLQKQLKELETAHHELSTTINNWKSNNSDLEGANSKLKEDYNLLKQEYAHQIEELTSNHGRLRDDYEKLRLILDDKDQTITQLQERKEDSQVNVTQKLQRSTTELHSLKTSYEALLDEHREYAAQIDELRKENNNVFGTYNKLKDDADNQLTIAHQQVSELKTLNLALTQEKEDNAQQTQQLTKTIEELEKSLLDNSTDWEARFHNLNNQYELAQKQLTELENDRNSAIERLSLLDGEYGKSISDWGAKYEDLKEQLNAAHLKISTLESDGQEEQQKLMVASAQNSQLISDWEDKYHSLLDQFNEAQTTISTLKEECNAAKELSNALESEKNEITERLNFLDSDRSLHNQEWESKYEMLSGQFNAANLRIGEVEQERNLLAEQLFELRGSHNQALAGWEDKYNSLLEQYNALQHQLGEIETEKQQAFEKLHLIDQEQQQTAGSWESKYHLLHEQYNQANHRIGELEQGKQLLLARFQEIEEEKGQALQSLEEEKNQLTMRLQHTGREQSDAVMAWESRYNDLLTQYNQLADQTNAFEAEKLNLAASLENDRLEALSGWEVRYSELLQQFEERNSQLAQLEHDNLQATNKIIELEDNNSQIINTWEEKYNHLLDQFNQHNQTLTNLERVNLSSQSEWEGKVSELETGNTDLLGQLDTARQEYESLSNEYSLYKNSIDTEFGELQNKLSELSTRLEGLSEENSLLKNELAGHTDQVTEYKTHIESLESARDKMQEDIQTLQTRYYAEMDEIVSDADSYKTKFENLLEAQKNSSLLLAEIEKERDQLAADYDKLNALYLSLSREEGGYKEKYEAVIARQKNFESIIADLESQLNKYREGKRLLRSTFSVEPEDVILDRIAKNAGQINFNRIGQATTESADDLSRIKGIGSFTVKKLNRLGIHSFSQLANLTPDDVNIVNEAIEYFPGRIEREDWVGQARIILGMVEQEDLKVIEGIGPAIESLLKEHGINTWKQLSQSSPETIKDILNTKGNQFSLHDPGTWPAQAELAASGKWQELSEWQNELKGGFEV